jgi:hypothetical protein
MPDFDYAGLTIGGVGLAWLITRLVEFLKVQGLSGKRWIWATAFVLGGTAAGLAGAMEQGLIPEAAMPWIIVGAYVFGGGVAACAAIGDYELNHKG